MSIQYEFTPHNTIRVECNGEVIEVLLPGSNSPTPLANGQPTANDDRGRGSPIVLKPIPVVPTKNNVGVMAIIAGKNRQPLDFDWTKFNSDVGLYRLDIYAMPQDDIAQIFAQNQVKLDIAGNGMKIANIGLQPWSGTTPKHLEELRRIVDNPDLAVDAVRLFRLPGSN